MLYYDHQLALMNLQHSLPIEDRHLHWPAVILAADKIRTWRDAKVSSIEVGTRAEEPAEEPTADAATIFDVAGRAPSSVMTNDWENEGGSLARPAARSNEPAYDFICIRDGVFIVGETQSDTLSRALEISRRPLQR